MCVAAIALPGKIIDGRYLRAMFDTNRDGGGLAFIDKSGKVQIRKGFMTVESFVKGYQDVLDGGFAEKNPVMVHVRAATVGKVGHDNCHPFAVERGAACHNGSFWGTIGPGSGRLCEKSDTREYVERLAKKFRYEDVLAAKDKIQELIGYNKMIFLFDKGKYIILGEEKLGTTWKDGVWYSNDWWMRRVDTRDTGTNGTHNPARNMLG